MYFYIKIQLLQLEDNNIVKPGSQAVTNNYYFFDLIPFVWMSSQTNQFVAVWQRICSFIKLLLSSKLLCHDHDFAINPRTWTETHEVDDIEVIDRVNACGSLWNQF